MNKKIIISSIFVLIALFSQNTVPEQQISFEEKWETMQTAYLQTESPIHLENIYCHPYWIQTKKNIRAFLLGNPNTGFLNIPEVSGNMIRTEPHPMMKYECCFLKTCLSTETQKKLNLFKDTDLLPQTCPEFDCSINTLGHLFYAARVFEKTKNINTIIELGGGYGNVIRIFKQITPETTILSIDLPELLAIQYLFLTTTLPDVKVFFHTTLPTEFQAGAIHLLSVFLIEDLSIHADVFISTFGISESPKKLQEIIIQKQFFKAQTCYIVGQLNGWNAKFDHHSIIHHAIRKQYPDVECLPFYLIPDGYEIIGTM